VCGTADPQQPTMTTGGWGSPSVPSVIQTGKVSRTKSPQPSPASRLAPRARAEIGESLERWDGTPETSSKAQASIPGSGVWMGSDG
jgi:hypothetical protein